MVFSGFGPFSFAFGVDHKHALRLDISVLTLPSLIDVESEILRKI